MTSDTTQHPSPTPQPQPQAPDPLPRNGIHPGVLTLALGAFAIGLTEFSPAGLLPAIADDFNISAGTSGWVVGGYALSVAIGAVVMSLLASGRDRAWALRILVAIFVLGNLISTLAGSFGLLVTGRVIAALCHGAYMGISAAMAADLMPPQRRGKAVATVFSGITLAIVLGLPVGNFLGEVVGWRLTFAVMTGLGVLVLAALFVFVPTGERPASGGLGSETQWLRSSQVWLTLVVSVLGFGGVFGAFSYLGFTLEEVTGLSPTRVTVFLFLFGAGTFIGNLVGGSDRAARLGDRYLIGATAVVALVMVAFGVLASAPIAAGIGVLAMGAVGFSVTPGTQARVLAFSDGAGFASSANIAALNLGNWIGATASGLALDAGFGGAAPLFVGAALAAAAAAVMTLAARHRSDLDTSL
ncbi:MFS transporter [Dermacoccaceae bacterium W4C1]